MNYLETIKKIQYKDYKIDEQHHLLLFESLTKLSYLALRNNLTYYVTGSWALLFHTNKIYRTISDIDIIVEIEDLKNWLTVLQHEYDYIYLDDPKEFFEYCINNKKLLTFLHKKDKSKLEISVFFPEYRRSIYKKKIENMLFYYVLPLKLKLDKDFFYERPRDLDDIDFYSDLIY
jgi:hypothetical protein